MPHYLIRFTSRHRSTMILIAMTIIAIILIWLVFERLMDQVDKEVLILSITQITSL